MRAAQTTSARHDDSLSAAVALCIDTIAVDHERARPLRGGGCRLRPSAASPHAESPVAGLSEPLRWRVAACYRASFFACLRRRRSRTALSRVNLAMVVFFLAFEPISISSCV